VIRASRDAAVAYANTRETFGTRIANHQLVKQKIAEMEADYQMSHLLWLHAGYLKNEGKPNAKATSLAKWQATVRSEKAASMAIEVHGANGYSNDYPVPAQLQGRNHLRRHARHSHPHAGRLGPRFEEREARSQNTAAVQEITIRVIRVRVKRG
jgi:alkylation response protein AidB-like acyl-CoA dehydrogenase